LFQAGNCKYILYVKEVEMVVVVVVVVFVVVVVIIIPAFHIFSSYFHTLIT
jgi:hypothetical protein